MKPEDNIYDRSSQAAGKSTLKIARHELSKVDCPGVALRNHRAGRFSAIDMCAVELLCRGDTDVCVVSTGIFTVSDRCKSTLAEDS